MIEAVLFDYGMVLSGPADPASWAQMKRITGLDEENFHAAYWSPRHDYDRGTHTGQQYWLAVGRHAGLELSGAQILSLLAADIALWTTLNEPMVAWALRLQAAGTRTGILSNLGDEMTRGVLATLPWMEGFYHKLFSHAVKLAKPEIEIYRHAAEGLQTAPEKILFIDDRAENCDAGRSAGMQVLQYGHPAKFIADMEGRGLAELWRAGKQSASQDRI